jgi:Tol biopolymer transport system component
VSATTSGHVIRRLADGLGTIGPARWSPDGRLIVFSVRGGGSCGSTQLWVVQVSGSGLRKLSDCANYPAWAPDSKHIVFIGNFSDGRSGSVSVIDVDGNERKDLVDWSGTSAPTLAWAPRGDRIAFTAGSGAGAVEIVDAAMKGNAVTIRHASSPAWRPDGRGLAIIRIQRPYDRLALQVVRPDGSNVQRVDRGAGISTPAWSRDGRLAYLKTPIAEGGGLGVFVARPGAPPRRLTQEPSDTVDFGLFWSLRSDRIFYLRCRT